MKPKLFIVMEYPEDFPSEKYSIMRSQLQRRATEWSESKTDNVLMLMVPEGVKVTAYAVPSDALLTFPEVHVKIIPE